MKLRSDKLPGEQSGRPEYVPKHMPDKEYRELGAQNGANTGYRTDMKRAVLSLAEEAGEALREEISREDWRLIFLEGFKDRLRAKKRDAIALYAQAMRLVGAERSLAISIWMNLGVNDERQAAQLIEMAKGAMSLSEHEQAARMVDAMENYLRKNPGQRDAVLQRLGGTMIETSEILEAEHEMAVDQSEA